MARERNQRSLWQVLGVYVAASWVCLQVVDVLMPNLGLPPWVFTLTLGILAAGLPVTAVTAWVQGIGRRDPSDSSSRTGLFTWKNLRTAGIVALAIWAIAITAWVVQSSHDTADSERNLVENLDEIQRLVGEWKYPEAYAIAKKLDDEITDESIRTEMWSNVSREITLETEPPGAAVFRRNYESTEADWEELGTTPLEIERFPKGLSRIRFELQGHIPRETANFSGFLANAGVFVLDTPETMPAGMTRVSGASGHINAPGLEQAAPLELGDFFMDIHEVTNRQYKEFVDAGGYADPACWKYSFDREGQTLSFDEAMALFVDQTGRAGPSGWRIGSYPDGEEDLPVSGVSWYEAAAYACFVGKSLPTVYHWFMAADPYSSNHVVPLSNYNDKGAAPVGQYKGVSRDGIYDLAGNVREWAQNPDGEARFILGGGWSDPEYAFNDAVTSPAFDRSAPNGIRLVLYPDDTNLAAASATIEKEFRDFTVEQPVSDDVFEVYRQMYEYDETPLNAVVVKTIEEVSYIGQRIDMDAAYNEERLTVFVFLPKDSKRSDPYQAVVLFPGSGSLYTRSYDDLDPRAVEFILRSGRALIYPAYKGTYERQSELQRDVQDASNLYRDHMIAWTRDIGRAIDYVETRDDIDAEKLAFLGYSWGGAVGPVMAAIERRFKTAIFFVGGLNMQDVQPMADPFNFLPRITVPTFMFNGRYDSFFPLETSIMPFFDNLGTPDADKKLTIVDSNHFVAAYNSDQLIGETLDWLDKYLGKVQ